MRGLGFVERVGFEQLDTLPAFFGAVSRETRRSVQAMLPLDLDPRTAAPLVSTAERPDYLEGIDLQQLSRALIRPVRAVADRGGKSWRSYVALACCDAVGGDSQPYLSWLALPELMHVGSLLVDDVQDGSTVRRGGPAAHVLYGEGPSLNAGAACYFLPHLFMEQTRLPDSARLRIYELYLAAPRGARRPGAGPGRLAGGPPNGLGAGRRRPGRAPGTGGAPPQVGRPGGGPGPRGGHPGPRQ